MHSFEKNIQIQIEFAHWRLCRVETPPPLHPLKPTPKIIFSIFSTHSATKIPNSTSTHATPLLLLRQDHNNGSIFFSEIFKLAGF